MSTYADDKKLVKLLVDNYGLDEEELKGLLTTLEPRKKVAKKASPKKVGSQKIVVSEYSEKAGIIKGLDTRQDPQLKEAVSEAKLFRWNGNLGGWVFPLKKMDEVKSFLKENKLKFVEE